MVANAYPRTFVPAEMKLENFDDVEPLYRELIERPIGSARELERWLRDLSELSAVVDEDSTRRYIAKSCQTDDVELEKRFLKFVEEIEPKIKPLFFQLQRKFLDSPHRAELSAGPRHAMLARTWRPDVEVYRDENVPLVTEIVKRINEYDKISGAMTVQLRGQEYTLQQAARFLEEPDREVREEAFRATVARRLQDRERIEAIYETLLSLRQRVATNAGLPDFRSYVWKICKRFDYTPDDCLRFADGIASSVVPLATELDRQRLADLGLEKLRPWDAQVDPKNRPPLRPFEQDQTDLLVDKVGSIFERMSPALAGEFRSLRENRNLDLASRKGKQPGGYQAHLDEVRQPFIFMNAVGTQRDVEVLLHEGGHAFHSLAARDEELVFLRAAPMEFCEVASMSMEALASDHYDVFYPDAAHAARAKRAYLEGVIRFFPWMAIIDSFQHWIYTHPGHAREQRTAEWLRLLDRFAPTDLYDWSGLGDWRAASWQRQLHLFHVPFYYIEYGIAQLGALQVWMKAKENPRQAIDNYRAALALGGTRSLPELFAAAGIRFDFTERTLRPLMDAVGEELSRLPS